MNRLVNVELENITSRRHLLENIPGQFIKIVKVVTDNKNELDVFISSFKLFYVKIRSSNKDKNTFVYLHDCADIIKLINNKGGLNEFKLKCLVLFNKQREISLLNKTTWQTDKCFFIDIYNLYSSYNLECFLPYVVINPFKISYKNEKILSI